MYLHKEIYRGFATVIFKLNYFINYIYLWFVYSNMPVQRWIEFQTRLYVSTCLNLFWDILIECSVFVHNLILVDIQSGSNITDYKIYINI